MKIYTTSEITKKLNRKNKIGKFIGHFIFIIIVAILSINIILLLQKTKNPEKLPSIAGYKSLVVASGSMEPTLNIGDMIIIKETNVDEIKEGDIITFYEEGYLVTHRIVEIVNNEGVISYKTKGDNNNANDIELRKYEDVEGVYKFKIEKIGNIAMNAQNQIVIFIILCVIYFIYRIISRSGDRRIARHEKRKEYEEKNKLN